MTRVNTVGTGLGVHEEFGDTRPKVGGSVTVTRGVQSVHEEHEK